VQTAIIGLLGVIIGAILIYISKVILLTSQIKFEWYKDLVHKRTVAFQNMIHLINFIANLKNEKINFKSKVSHVEWDKIVRENISNKLFFPDEMRGYVDNVFTTIYKLNNDIITFNDIDFGAFWKLEKAIYAYQKEQMERIERSNIFAYLPSWIKGK
jgi:hypothetical protein